MNVKRGFLLFVTSCLSGCGQMYQGYLKRGISLLLLFFALLAAAGFLSLAPIAFFLPVFLCLLDKRGKILAEERPASLHSAQDPLLLQSRHRFPQGIAANSNQFAELFLNRKFFSDFPGSGIDLLCQGMDRFFTFGHAQIIPSFPSSVFPERRT